MEQRIIDSSYRGEIAEHITRAREHPAAHLAIWWGTYFQPTHLHINDLCESNH